MDIKVIEELLHEELTERYQQRKHQIIPVDKKFVHKTYEENVLIYNLRRAIPRQIRSQLMEESILPRLSREDREFLLTYYSKIPYQFIMEEKEELTDPNYILLSLPHVINFNAFYEYLDTGRMSFGDLRYFLKFYYRDKIRKKFIMIDTIDEEDELKLLKILNLKKWHITSEKKARISDILDQAESEELKKKDVFFSNMHIDIDHSFFFEHPNEHVPALMTTEASRQFLIAICHKFLNVPFSGYSFILSSMQFNFLNYLDLNFPVTFMGKVNNLKTRKNVATYIDIDVIVWQKNKQAASINYIGKGISSNVFNVLREDKTTNVMSPRFHPRAIAHHNISIRSTKRNKKYLCDLIDVSKEGFSVDFIDDFNDILDDENDQLEFFIYFQDIGFIHGKCEQKWFDEKNDGSLIVGFKITDILPDDHQSLNEAIKRFCYVLEDREIL